MEQPRDSSQRWLTKDVTTISDPDWDICVVWLCAQVLRSESDAIYKGTQTLLADSILFSSILRLRIL